MEPLIIRTLGEFSIQSGNQTLSDRDNRTRKLWLLLAFLLCQRGRSVSSDKLIQLLWGDDPSSTNPENALRITFHRARTLLNKLWPTAGKDLLLHQEAGYAWNTAIPIALDADRFEFLCLQQQADPDGRLDDLLEALRLYRGEFLDKQSTQTWVIPISTHYQNLYLKAVTEAVALLAAKDRHEEAAVLCQTAIRSEPYHEPLHQFLIRELAAQGNISGAEAVYTALRKRLFDDFGIHPSPQTREVYRSAVVESGNATLPMEAVMDQLREEAPPSGALQCDYDYFKVLCHAQSRDMERSGNVIHILLLSIIPDGTKPIAKRSVQRLAGQLGEQIRLNLRRGDVFSRCSPSQYIILLPKANYENSCMVCRRVIAAFRRAHPHVTASVQYMVQPLTPYTNVP